MKTLTIGFSRSSGKLAIFSWLIMLVQWTRYSHVYFKLTEMGVDLVLQASSTQVNMVTDAYFLSKETVYQEFTLSLTEQTYEKVLLALLADLGEPYSLLQILNSFIYLLCKKAPLDKYISGWDCSKLVAMTLKDELGFKIDEDLDVITPKDMYKIMETYETTSTHN